MALINHANREINAKLVYVGPAHSGKATNLNLIHKKLKPECRGKLKSMAVQQDRMLFFDFTLPGQGEVGGYRVRFHVYTLVGNVTRSAAWKMVLKGADGVVFVAYSAADKVTANRESLATLEEQLRGYGKPLQEIPCVVQCNKRDVAGAVSLDQMRQGLAVGSSPVVPAVAAKGEGVLDALFAVMKPVMKNLKESGLDLERGTEQLAGLAEPEASPVLEPASLPPGEDSGVPSPAGSEVVPERAPAVGAVGEDEAPTIEISGEPVAVSEGRLRLPLTVRYGGRVKKVAIMFAFSLESGDAE